MDLPLTGFLYNLIFKLKFLFYSAGGRTDWSGYGGESENFPTFRINFLLPKNFNLLLGAAPWTPHPTFAPWTPRPNFAPYATRKPVDLKFDVPSKVFKTFVIFFLKTLIFFIFFGLTFLL